MRVDIAFIDRICAQPFDSSQLEIEAMGATEATTIRLAEYMSKQGLSVVIVQHNRFTPAITSENGVMYAPWRWYNIIKPKNVIHLRSIQSLPDFKDSNQLVWMHDAADNTSFNNISTWPEMTKQYNPTFITVSNWHTSNILENAPGLNVKRIYPPIDQKCLDWNNDGQYDKNQLIWLSSPHKGLDKGIGTFLKLLGANPEFKLIITNPGYCDAPQFDHPRIVYLDRCSRETLRNITAKSLCLFYPTDFKETLGLVAIEANALGTPVATYPIAGLAEGVNNKFCTDEENFIETVLDWYNNGRPTVKAKQDFSLEIAFLQWRELLKL